jgi:hypothetical protein
MRSDGGASCSAAVTVLAVVLIVVLVGMAIDDPIVIDIARL